MSTNPGTYRFYAEVIELVETSTADGLALAENRTWRLRGRMAPLGRIQDLSASATAPDRIRVRPQYTFRIRNYGTVAERLLDPTSRFRVREIETGKTFDVDGTRLASWHGTEVEMTLTEIEYE